MYWLQDIKNNLKQIFQQELACTAFSAHDVHEDKHAGQVQEGGTGIICSGECTGYIKKVGRDEAGLGRWSWILMGGTNGHNTRIITAYNPCKNKNINSGTSYQQQQRYFNTRKKDLTCLLVLFRRDLINQLQQWQEAGEKIILFIDDNEYVTKGALRKALGDGDKLHLQRANFHHTGKS
jgi:hypothetical protein